MERKITDVYNRCKQQAGLPKEQMVNYVRKIYEPFSSEELSAKIVEMLRTPQIESDIQIVYQSIEGLHQACPNHPGDWYFTGNYPTPGGVRMLNRAYIDYYEEIYSKTMPKLPFTK